MRACLLLAALLALPASCRKERTDRRAAAQAERPIVVRPMPAHPVVRFRTTLGTFTAVLFRDKAPRAVALFLENVRSHVYRGSIFHRVLPGTLVQAGGYDANLHRLPLPRPVVSEAGNGLKNLRGTLALARYDWDPHSGNGEFFVNLRDNPQFDWRGPEPQAQGYTVFGRVLSGLDVLDRISRLRVCPKPPFWNKPCRPPKILSAVVLPHSSLQTRTQIRGRSSSRNGPLGSISAACLL